MGTHRCSEEFRQEPATAEVTAPAGHQIHQCPTGMILPGPRPPVADPGQDHPSLTHTVQQSRSSGQRNTIPAVGLMECCDGAYEC